MTRVVGFPKVEPRVRYRSHSIDFKRQVAQEFIAGETLHGLAKRHDVSRTLIRIWVRKYKAQSMKMLRRPTSSRNTKPASPRSTVSLETGAGIGASKEGSEKRAAAEKRDRIELVIGAVRRWCAENHCKIDGRGAMKAAIDLAQSNVVGELLSQQIGWGLGAGLTLYEKIDRDNSMTSPKSLSAAPPGVFLNDWVAGLPLSSSSKASASQSLYDVGRTTRLRAFFAGFDVTEPVVVALPIDRVRGSRCYPQYPRLAAPEERPSK